MYLRSPPFAGISHATSSSLATCAGARASVGVFTGEFLRKRLLPGVVEQLQTKGKADPVLGNVACFSGSKGRIEGGAKRGSTQQNASERRGT